MSSSEFEKALATLGVNQIEAAELLGVDDRTIRRWVGKERDVPGPAIQFLRYLVAIKRSGASAIKTLGKN